MDLITLAAKVANIAGNPHGTNGSINEPWSPVGTWAFGIVIVGAVLLFFSFLPGWINTVRTKDTASMSLGMWIISVVGLAFLVIFYALGMANRPKLPGGGLGPVSAQFTVVFVCEALSLLLSIYILIYKLFNMGMAHKLGITEKEYCEKLAAKSGKGIGQLFGHRHHEPVENK